MRYGTPQTPRKKTSPAQSGKTEPESPGVGDDEDEQTVSQTPQEEKLEKEPAQKMTL